MLQFVLPPLSKHQEHSQDYAERQRELCLQTCLFDRVKEKSDRDEGDEVETIKKIHMWMRFSAMPCSSSRNVNYQLSISDATK